MDVSSTNMYRIHVYFVWLCLINFIKLKGLETNGQTSYYNSALGGHRSCADICEPPHGPIRSCAYYCAEYKTQPARNPAKQNNKSGGRWWFGFFSIPVLILMAAVALYLVKKQRKNNNESAQLTQDIELQTIIVSSNNGSCDGGGIQETSEEYPHEHQHLLGSRSDLTTANATGAIVWPDSDPMAFPRQASTPSVMTNAVLDTIMLTENSRVAGVPGLPPVSENNEEGSHTTNCTVNVNNFKRVVIDRSDSLDCDVTIRARETRV